VSRWEGARALADVSETVHAAFHGTPDLDGTVYPADEIVRYTAATPAADSGRVVATADLTG